MTYFFDFATSYINEIQKKDGKKDVFFPFLCISSFVCENILSRFLFIFHSRTCVLVSCCLVMPTVLHFFSLYINLNAFYIF